MNIVTISVEGLTVKATQFKRDVVQTLQEEVKYALAVEIGKLLLLKWKRMRTDTPCYEQSIFKNMYTPVQEIVIKSYI